MAQMIANQIDRSLVTTIGELKETLQMADFDPSSSNLDAETLVLAEYYVQPNLSIQQIVFLDSQGDIVLTHPSDGFIPDTYLSNFSYDVQPIENGSVYISTPYQDPSGENLVTSITIPIYKEDQFLGWLGCVVDLDEPSIKTLLKDAVALDHTAHGILVDSQGRALISTFDLPFLSSGEHHTFYRQAIADGQPVVKEVLFELDLPGEPPGHHHIMAFAPLKTVQWGVSIGGDVVGETFAESYQLFILLAFFFILSVVAVWGTTMVSTKKLLEPVKDVNLKLNISQQIADVKDWEELKSLVVRIPSFFLPVSSTRLLLPDAIGKIRVVSEWSSDGKSPTCPSPFQTAGSCATCALARSDTVRALTLCSHQIASSENLNCFCLPLVHQDSLIGTLHFSLPSDENLSEKQMDVLTSIASNVAIAIESAELQRSNLEQIEITQAEKKRIFRRVHDTLGQNITYLRLKLDQYSMVETSTNLLELQKGIDGMRKVAEEAHEQIRNILTDLHPETQTDLVAALRARANAVAERAHFDFKLIVEGQSTNLSQQIKRHVLFICHEALSNIEKHANAQNVTFRLIWGDHDLTIIITDDGSGFDPKKISPDEHFGLEIMQERSRAINGKLALTPLLENGTEVRLWIPLLPSS